MTNDRRLWARLWSLVVGSRLLSALVIGAWSLVIMATACDRRQSSPVSAKSPKIASLVPAATDLILGMGAGEHLVAVSNWEADLPQIAHLPRVGDYDSTDWEKLAELRPDVMVVFMSPDRMPPGLRQRADRLGMKLVNVKIERLGDIFAAISMFGELLDERDKAAALEQRLRQQLDAVSKRVAAEARVPTLVVHDEQGFALIAGDTFIDDLLTIAGGRNVAGDLAVRYPSVDRERLIELAPQAIIQLMPQASGQLVDRARQTWQNLPMLPAVAGGRVYILTDWYVLQPGSHVGELAEQFADRLHPPR